MINLDHSHHIHIIEFGAPKFHLEVVAMIGAERHILAYITRTGAEGKKLAVEYVDALCQSLSRTGHLYQAPMYPRHNDPVHTR
jgi:hypothetical protein